MEGPNKQRLYAPVSRKGQEMIRTSPLSNWTELRSLICSIVNVRADLDGLEAAIERFSATRPAPWSFYTDLLPKIKAWALDDVTASFPIMKPYSPETASISVSARAARHVLANAFFLNIVLLDTDVRMHCRLGELSYFGLYTNSYTPSVERIACQIAYFFASHDDAEVNTRPPIVFERSWPQEAIEKREAFWQSSTALLPPLDRVNVHSQSMEEMPGKAFVDFANKFIHIGCLIPSLTQEEVLFSCCPEAFLCLLFIGELRDREVVVIRNIRRFSTYTGYLDRLMRQFRWVGLWPALRLHDILVVDACIGSQFRVENVIRDLEKACLSFAACKDDRISTGHWGCGAFGGDKTLKFLQQLCAAAVANAHLDYSTFKDEPLAAHFKELHRKLLEKKVPVGRVVRTFPRFLERRALVSEFAGWIEEELLKDEETPKEAEKRDAQEEKEPDV